MGVLGVQQRLLPSPGLRPLPHVETAGMGSLACWSQPLLPREARGLPQDHRGLSQVCACAVFKEQGRGLLKVVAGPSPSARIPPPPRACSSLP